MNDGDPTLEEIDTWVEQHQIEVEYRQLLDEEAERDEQDARDAAIEERFQRECYEADERDGRHLWATR